MAIYFSRESQNALKSYDRKIRTRILQAIARIPKGSIRPLIGSNPRVYRLRVGKYRALFIYDTDKNIKILKIDSRGDVYK